MSEEQIDLVAREIYRASCALDPLEPQEPDWGRGGYKTQVMYWHGLARAAMRALGENQPMKIGPLA